MAVQINHKQIEQAMRENGIAVLRLDRKVRPLSREPGPTPVPSLLQRTASPAMPRATGLGITNLPVGDSTFLYPTTVLDLGSSARWAGRSPAERAQDSWSMCVVPPAATSATSTLRRSGRHTR